MAAIRGNLPFGTMSPNNGTDYAAAYNSALSMNSANYQNILQGYNQSRAEMTTANDAIASGYMDLAGEVTQALSAAEQGQREDIQASASRAASQGVQSLIGRGLGNSTVTQAVSRGVAGDKNRAVNDLVGKMSGLRANYISQLRQAGLQQRAMSAQQKSGMDRDMLAWMNSISSPYPDAQKYAALQQQLGAARAAQANRGMGGGGGGGMPPRQPQGGGGPVGRVQQQPRQPGAPPPMNNQGLHPNPWGAGLGAVAGGIGMVPPGAGPNGQNPGACPGGNCGPGGAMPPGGTASPPGSWYGGSESGSGGMGDPSGGGGYGYPGHWGSEAEADAAKAAQQAWLQPQGSGNYGQQQTPGVDYGAGSPSYPYQLGPDFQGNGSAGGYSYWDNAMGVGQTVEPYTPQNYYDYSPQEMPMNSGGYGEY